MDRCKSGRRVGGRRSANVSLADIRVAGRQPCAEACSLPLSPREWDRSFSRHIHGYDRRRKPKPTATELRGPRAVVPESEFVPRRNACGLALAVGSLDRKGVRLFECGRSELYVEDNF